MGVWIEIYKATEDLYVIAVTPFVGVWIEMAMLGCPAMLRCRHSLRGSVD